MGRPRHNNLSPEEKDTLRDLKNNTSIVIKKADKGGAVVVMNTVDYINEAQCLLDDGNFYRKETENFTDRHMKEIQNTVYNIYRQGDIDKTCKGYLADFEPRTARFYLPPKIHKNVRPPPGRPIISANGCPTERISEWTISSNHWFQKSNHISKMQHIL